MTASGAGTFAYDALRADGETERGVVTASSAAEALSSLGERGLLPVSVRHVATRREQRRRIPARDLALGLRVLADLLEAGLPLARALRDPSLARGRARRKESRRCVRRSPD
jgi:general secretion pathway protein F